MVNHLPKKKPNPFRLYHLSIRQRLPLLICILLLSIILVFGCISYLGVRKASLKIGEERLQTLTGQLSSMLGGSTQKLVSTTFIAANKSAIKKYLLSKGIDSTKESLKILDGLRRDSTYFGAVLLNADGVPVLHSDKKRIDLQVNIDSIFSLNQPAPTDSGRVGKLYAIRDSVFYPVIANVVDSNRSIGWIVSWRTLVANKNSVQQLSQLLGTDAKLYLGNADGNLWTDMIKPAHFPKTQMQKINTVMEYSRGKRPVLALIQPVKNCHWLVLMELSKEKVLEASNQFLYWLIIAGNLLLVIGIFTTWLMSRNITQPLKDLTIAASQIASGNYAINVNNQRHDELGKLARSFNAMNVQIRNSQKKLQTKAENYKLLFENNPMPMWIISRASLNIMDVNKAAFNHYGYSKDEFLQLSAKDIWSDTDPGKYQEYIKRIPNENISGICRHKKKNGTPITIDIIADDIIYEGQQARIILANDITEKLKAEAELVQHRLLQQEIIAETAIQAHEQERDELGRELHDNINQILASTKLYLEIACNSDTELSTQALSRGYENVNLAIAEIRRLSKQLVPPVLEDMLTNVLKEMTDEIHAATNINFIFDLTAFDEKKLNDDIKLMIYRIVQEQVNNIVKHARASQVHINITNDAKQISLLIADNGVGFDTKQKSKGIGLRNIENRVKFYKGNATIRSEREKGCILEVYIPMKNMTAVLQ
jgi:PAS domain S-box-containing protein